MQLKTLVKTASMVLVCALLVVLTSCAGQNGPNASKASSSKPSDSPDKKEDGSNAEASAAVKHFSDTEIKVIIPVSAGGGMDTQTRILLPIWEEYLPEKTKMVTMNKPGGEYNPATIELWNAKPDGHTIQLFPGVMLNQLIEKVPYDIRKFEWIGRMTEGIYIGAVSKKSGIKNFDEFIKKKTVSAGVTGVSSGAGLFMMITGKELGLQIKPIAHKGATEAILASIRGDVDWVQYPFSGIKSAVMDSNDLTPIMVFNDKRLPELPDVPTAEELGHSDLLEIVSFPRMFATTPGTPPEVLKILRDSFKKAVEDPRFVEQITKNERPPQYMGPDDVLKLVTKTLSKYEKYTDMIKELRK